MVALRTLVALVLLSVGLVSARAVAGTAEVQQDVSAAEVARIPNPSGASGCLRELDRLGIDYERAREPGIELAVRVRGRIGGVEFRGYRDRPLVLDCSLVVSLARSQGFFAEHGIESAIYSSAYQRRRVRRTGRWSNHSYGLAIDIHTLKGEAAGELRVREDFEQGLGDAIDCVGAPLTEGGAMLKILQCQLERSEQFRMILTPDYDADHHNHFHVEALPWSERAHD